MYLQILWVTKNTLLTAYVPYIFGLGPLGKYNLGPFWKIYFTMFPEAVLVAPVMIQEGAG